MQIEKQLTSINCKKSTGYDQIPPRVIKLCAKELSQTFTKIVNNSITQNVFPVDLKKAEVTQFTRTKIRKCLTHILQNP